MNQDDVSTGAMFAFSQASPCCTVPLCMSSLMFGVIHTKSGAFAPSSAATAPEPGYLTSFVEHWLSPSRTNGLWCHTYGLESLVSHAFGMDSIHATHGMPAVLSCPPSDGV